jgi:RNA polymerase sigma factor (sigma-70 family)
VTAHDAMQRLAQHKLAVHMPLAVPFDHRDDDSLELAAGALLHRFREHDDTEAYVFLVELLHVRLVQIARRLTRGLAILADPEDLVAALMAKLFTDVRKGQPTVRRFLALSFTIMRNEAVNQLRKRQRLHQHTLQYGELQADLHAPADPALLILDRERNDDVRLLGTVFLTVVGQCFHSLSERDRRALTLREIQALSYEDIAEALGLPRSQIGMIIRRARTRLARQIDKMFQALHLRLLSRGLTNQPAIPPSASHPALPRNFKS